MKSQTKEINNRVTKQNKYTIIYTQRKVKTTNIEDNKSCKGINNNNKNENVEKKNMAHVS